MASTHMRMVASLMLLVFLVVCTITVDARASSPPDHTESPTHERTRRTLQSVMDSLAEFFKSGQNGEKSAAHNGLEGVMNLGMSFINSLTGGAKSK